MQPGQAGGRVVPALTWLQVLGTHPSDSQHLSFGVMVKSQALESAGADLSPGLANWETWDVGKYPGASVSLVEKQFLTCGVPLFVTSPC